MPRQGRPCFVHSWEIVNVTSIEEVEGGHLRLEFDTFDWYLLHYLDLAPGMYHFHKCRSCGVIGWADECTEGKEVIDVG